MVRNSFLYHNPIHTHTHTRVHVLMCVRETEAVLVLGVYDTY